MTDQQAILERQEKDQQDKVRASVPDKKKLTELEKQVEHLKKGKKFCTPIRVLLFVSLIIITVIFIVINLFIIVVDITAVVS